MMKTPSSPIVRIGGACPIDIAASLPQLILQGELDYLIIDFLSEFSLPMLVQNRIASPGSGFAPGFTGPEVAANLADALRRGLRIVTNAGGVEPHGCARTLAQLASAQGLSPRIAVVEGDDLLADAMTLRRYGLVNGQQLPDVIASLNAYIGALPIAVALGRGADIVITGRAVDSALALGPLIHEFGWRTDDYDLLAAGTLIGHLLECGAQPVGGIFTDWRDVPDWSDPSFPIAECRPDGTAIITKVAGTGGVVSVGSVSEQAIYEIGDPQRYLMPDVTCDFSGIRLEQVTSDRVRVSGARGYPPTGRYKTIATYADGWRGTVSFVLRGIDAQAKADRVAGALLRKTEHMLRDRNLGAWKASHIELIGAEASYGAHAQVGSSREIVCRMVVDHDDRAAVEMFLRVQRAISVSMAPGIATVPLGSSVSPVFRVVSDLIDKACAPLAVAIEGTRIPIPVPTADGFAGTTIAATPSLPEAVIPSGRDVRLIDLAWARSGDKGDMSNIAVIAREPIYLPAIKASLTPNAVAQWFEHLTEDDVLPLVERYELPGPHALNFLLHAVLGGGGSASMRFDPMGKALAQQLLDFPITVDADIAATLERSAG